MVEHQNGSKYVYFKSIMGGMIDFTLFLVETCGDLNQRDYRYIFIAVEISVSPRKMALHYREYKKGKLRRAVVRRSHSYEEMSDRPIKCRCMR